MIEARRNPHLNPKISIYDALKPYSNDPSYYISFTEEDKIGINPQSYHGTPLGIYAYPLKEIWEEYRIDHTKDVGNAVPFGGDRPYVWLLKPKQSANILRDIDKYTKEQLKQDIQKLYQYVTFHQDEFESMFKLNKNLTPEAVVETTIDKWLKDLIRSAPFRILWIIAMHFASIKCRGDVLTSSMSVQWNLIFSRLLGYDGFVDNNGAGLIHAAEPIQAVFFSKTVLETKGQFYNKNYKKSVNEFLKEKMSL